MDVLVDIGLTFNTPLEMHTATEPAATTISPDAFNTPLEMHTATEPAATTISPDAFNTPLEMLKAEQ